jgi:hypothetical protein
MRQIDWLVSMLKVGSRRINIVNCFELCGIGSCLSQRMGDIRRDPAKYGLEDYDILSRRVPSKSYKEYWAEVKK